MIDFNKLEKSLAHLKAQQNNRCALPPEMPTLMREAVDESVIQRFETCYDTLWKTLRRYLREELGLAETPASPKPIFRLANENNLLLSDIAHWLEYANARIATAHDYSDEKAQAALALMDRFIEDAEALLQSLTGRR
ncbi:nucleotidyltransferase substrate binding protein [Magnetofaba australis]|uniref:Putative nucleotidyltransferase substrate binding-like protein n=1 Tax=Magnetofaba australis IT-1 TaxID=1434232 RepID=A0A1Y2KB14_9PROT|nr:nucleotidyltransferase substrate binding protein [Magnetofaba australis]OSM08776.1 putative nucleotidyltransferase substrate binding-like protein [Magnetofaba australis IT-1]